MRMRLAAPAVVALSLGLAAPAAAQQPPDWLEYENGATKSQFNFSKAIEEVVWVESEVDSDRDGARDLIRLRISRPSEPAADGHKVPVVFEHSPYRGGTGNPANHGVDFDTMPQEEGATATASAASEERGKRSGRQARGPRADLPGS